MDIEWSDVLGNSASAQEIIDQYLESNPMDAMGLAEWITEQANSEFGNSITEAQSYDIMRGLCVSAIERRMRDTDLEEFRDTVFYDWPNQYEHLLWAAAAPVNEVLSWARSIGRNA